MTPKQTTTKLEAVKAGRTETRKPDWGTGKNAHIVILRSEGGFFGVDINLVQEIVLMQDLTEVPGSADHVAGMTDLRGRVVPVAEFSRLLGYEPGERTDDTRILVVEDSGGHIGLIVDAVTEVMMVEGDKIEDATTIGSVEHDFIIAVAKMDDHLVSLVDVGRLLETADQQSIELAAAAA